MSVRELAFDPDSFFEHSSVCSLRYAALVVLFVGVSTMIGTAYLLYRSWVAVNPESLLPLVIWVPTIIAVPVGTAVTWLVVSLLFHFISKLYEAEANYRTLLGHTGWGFVPQLFSGLVNTTVTVIVASDATFPDDPTELGPFIQSIGQDPLFVVSSILSIVFLIWSGFLWLFAVKHSRGLSQAQARYTVAIPVVALVAYRVYTLPVW